MAYSPLLPVTVNQVPCDALVDSGNLFRSVISADFAKRLGLTRHDLRRIPGLDTVGTAKQGADLTVLGETKRPLSMRLAGTACEFSLQPVVLEGLGMDLNLSGPYLKRHGIDQLHSEDAIRVKGTLVKLKAAGSRRPAYEGASTVYTVNNITVEPFATQQVELRVKGFEAQTMEIQDGCLDGSPDFEARFGIHAVRGAILRPPPEKPVLIGQVLNTSRDAIVIPKGAYYGTFTALDTTPDADRVCLLQEESLEPVGADDKWLRGPTTRRNYERRANHVLDVFGFRKNPLLATNKAKAHAVGLILKYWEVFSFTGEFGLTSLLQHEIKTVPGTKPINVRYRPVNPALEPSLKKQVDKWVSEDVIEPAQSPWNFGLVPASKKGTTEKRWCLDFRPLNAVTVRDRISIGDISDNLARLARSKVFSAIDASGAFHQIPLHPDSRDKTAFCTPFGQYRFKRMPFGICNGPAEYTRLVHMALHGIPPSVALAYLDDCLVHSGTVEDHFEHLARVLEAHQRAGLKLKPSKCNLFQDSVEYLGHVVTAEGLKPVPAFVQDVVSWPCPRTRSQVRTFLGKANYYRRFLEGFAAIVKPLVEKTAQDGTKDNEPFEPSADFTKSFETLKKALVSAPILGHPDFQSESPFILDTDWSFSNKAIGGVLSQKQDGLERVIMYGSHKLEKSRQNYGATKGELFAIVFFISKWSYYLRYRPFILRTDHEALRAFKKMEAPNGMEQRWLQLLADHDFVVEYRPGPKHGNADALSRAEHIKEQGEEPVEEDDYEYRTIQALLAKEDQRIPRSRILKAQMADPDIRAVLQYVRGRQAAPQDFAKGGSDLRHALADQLPHLFYSSGLLFHKGTDGKNRLVLPTSLRRAVATKSHQLVAHRGVRATLDKAREVVFSPGLAKEAEYVVQSCIQCQTKTTPTEQKGLHVPTLADYPFQLLSIDFVGPLPRSREGFMYIFTIRDVFTKWTEFYPTRDMLASTVISKLAKEFFPRFGLPERIHSDRGTQFTSKSFIDTAHALGVEVTTTPSYNPKSNPCERAHRDLKAALNALCRDKPSTWPEALPAILMAMRNTPCATTGVSPSLQSSGARPQLTSTSSSPSPRRRRRLAASNNTPSNSGTESNKPTS